MDINTGDNFYGLVQYKTDGSRDSSFGTNGITIVPLEQQDEGKGTLALLPDGKILAATTVVNDTSFFYEFGLLRFNANGCRIWQCRDHSPGTELLSQHPA